MSHEAMSQAPKAMTMEAGISTCKYVVVGCLKNLEKNDCFQRHGLEKHFLSHNDAAHVSFCFLYCF